MTAEELLEQLAAIWVARWLKYGGGLIVDDACDNIQISVREMGWRRRKTGREGWQRQQCLWHDGWNIGRWRELNELAIEVPGLREAIIHHVALHGRRMPGGSYHLYLPREETIAA